MIIMSILFRTAFFAHFFDFQIENNRCNRYRQRRAPYLCTHAYITVYTTARLCTIIVINFTSDLHHRSRETVGLRCANLQRTCVVLNNSYLRGMWNERTRNTDKQQSTTSERLSYSHVLTKKYCLHRGEARKKIVPDKVFVKSTRRRAGRRHAFGNIIIVRF